MASSMRTQSVISWLRTYFSKNKKVIICTLVAFIVGVIAGVVACVRSVNGDFERVARADMEFGAFKVFFISLLALLGGYFVVLIAGTNNKTVFLIFLPFFRGRNVFDNALSFSYISHFTHSWQHPEIVQTKLS